MIRVLIADDSEDIRRVLQSLLDTEPGLSCIGCVANAREVAGAARDGNADIVLLDYRLPDGGGFAAMDDLARHSPSTKVIIHSGWNEPDIVEEAKRRGAAFLTKGTDIDEMFAVIRKMHDGKA
jgi:DNA-binding NarL/FixJ family response regulator